MNRQGFHVLFSILLISVGVLVLLSNLGVLPWDITSMQWFWLLVFGGGGLTFLAVLFSNSRENWWAAIPGFTLLGLAVLVSEIIPNQYSEWGGGLFLGMIGLSFWVVYFMRREFWWAIIPGGVLVTLALVAGLSGVIEGAGTGGLFFLGLAATFLMVYSVPTVDGRMRWAIWPAGILGLMGIFLTIGASSLARFVWPAALILFGGLMIYRAFAQKSHT